MGHHSLGLLCYVQCVCEIKYINQLQPEWAMAAAGFFRLYSPPQSYPQTTFPRTEVQGPSAKAGHLDLLPPKSLTEEKRNKKAKRQRERERENAPKRQESAAHVTSRPGDGPPPAYPFQTVWRGALAPPPPSTSSLSTPELSSPPSRGGIVTICPTSVFRRKDSTSLVALSPPKSKAILDALGCFHPQR